jgi:hypothetical protein
MSRPIRLCDLPPFTKVCCLERIPPNYSDYLPGYELVARTDVYRFGVLDVPGLEVSHADRPTPWSAFERKFEVGAEYWVVTVMRKTKSGAEVADVRATKVGA